MSVNYKELNSDQIEFAPVAEEGEIGNGERIFVDIDVHSVVVFNIAGEYLAIADLCSHDDGPVGDGEVEDHEVICPRHGARFDLRSGKVQALPAIVDIPAYPVRLKDGQIEVGVPTEN